MLFRTKTDVAISVSSSYCYADNIIMAFLSEEDATGTYPVCNWNTIAWMTCQLPQKLNLGSIKSQWG